MTQRHFPARWLGALGLTLALVGLISQGTTSAQSSLAELQESADRGDATAQDNLGFMHQIGLGVPQDDTQAVA